MARRVNAIHPGILVGLVVLTLVAATAIFLVYDKSNKLERALADKDQALIEAKQSEENFVNEKRQRIKEGQFIYGWDRNGDGAKLDVPALENWMLEKFAHRLDANLQTKEDKIKALITQRLTVTEYDRPDQEYVQKINEITEEYEKNKKDYLAEIEDIKKRRDQSIEELNTEIEQKQTTVDELNIQIGELTQQIDELRANHKTEIDSLNQKINEVRFVARSEKRRLSTDISRYKVEISSLEDLLDQKIGDRSAQLSPDGSVINVSSALHSNIAYVDLGQQDKVTRGMRFEVFQWGQGGTQRKKGEVIVREVYPYTSKVGIVSIVEEFDPIVQGDLIANIAFDPKKSREFALIGSFENFTKEELSRLIEKEGGKISQLVHAGLDYVVVGKFTEAENDPENIRYRRARDFHVQMLNEGEIRKFLRDYTN